MMFRRMTIFLQEKESISPVADVRDRIGFASERLSV
jgi:hypothetical protein